MRPAVGCAVIDVCGVLAFAAIGRHAHHDGDTVAGIWHTAWPFLVGLLLGLLAARAWRRPAALVPSGIGAWLGAAGLGMGIRVLAGQGTAAAFIAVTFLVMALFLLGWRVTARAVAARARQAH
ncbi:MAG TPA: DUF3054 domain-containing protein [Streptosporangiaceae bacterium]|nr:DUF3054 domain-containing protein [Streptosporangiaceae bacterium]